MKSDDREDDRRDIKRVWRANPTSIGLRSLARTYTARQETDGLVDLDWIEERLPDAEVREAAVATLIEHDLFVRLPAGETRMERLVRTASGKKVTFRVEYGPLDVDAFIMPDYLQHNEARVEADQRRREQAKKKADARAKRNGETALDVPQDNQDCPDGQPGDNPECPSDLGGVSTLSRPDPTRPDPTLIQIQKDPPSPPRGNRARDREKWRKELDEWVQANPATDELATEWKRVVESMVERSGNPAVVMMRTAYLHPHRLDGTPVFGSDAGGDPKRHTDGFGRQYLRQAFGTDPILIDCQCELAQRTAA